MGESGVEVSQCSDEGHGLRRCRARWSVRPMRVDHSDRPTTRIGRAPGRDRLGLGSSESLPIGGGPSVWQVQWRALRLLVCVRTPREIRSREGCQSTLWRTGESHYPLGHVIARRRLAVTFPKLRLFANLPHVAAVHPGRPEQSGPEALVCTSSLFRELSCLQILSCMPSAMIFTFFRVVVLFQSVCSMVSVLRHHRSPGHNGSKVNNYAKCTKRSGWCYVICVCLR